MKARLDGYLAKGAYPFHMPGHKGRCDFMPDELMKYDITELPGMDNLHAASGMIQDAQQRIAGLYGAEESCLLINGATAGIAAAVTAVCGEGGRVVVARNSHKSVYTGLVVAGAVPVYILPEMTPFGFAGGVCPFAVEKAFADYQDIKAVCITSPTYEGFVSDIPGIAGIVHAHNAVLIVDEAHGAHFPFHDAFPPPAITLGADITVNSLHKTLPVPSQCGVLHMRGKLVSRVLLRRLLSMYQTSSPSYLFMMLMDHVTGVLTNHPEHFAAYIQNLHAFREAFPTGKALSLLGMELAGRYGIQTIDMSKLVFYINHPAMTGPELERELIRRGLQMEMSGPYHVLAMTSVADEQSGFCQLSKSMDAVIHELTRCETGRPREQADAHILQPDVCCTPRRAFFMEQEEIPLSLCCGRIAGDFVIPYPPGIPILAPGERVTEPIMEHILLLLEKQCAVLGVCEMKIQVLKEMGTCI